MAVGLRTPSTRLMGSFGWRDNEAAAYLKVRYYKRVQGEKDRRRLAQIAAEFTADFDTMRQHPRCDFRGKSHAMAWVTLLALKEGRAASQVWNVMRAKGYLSPAMYAHKIRAAVNAKMEFSYVVNIRAEMKGASPPVTATLPVYEAFLFALAALPDRPRAWALLHNMVGGGAQWGLGKDTGRALILMLMGPDGGEETPAPLLAALRQDTTRRKGDSGGGALPDPLNVLDTAFQRFGIEWTAGLYRTLLGTAPFRRDVARCSAVLRRMQQAGVRPDAGCLHELMKAIAAGATPLRQLRDVHEHLKRQGWLRAETFRVHITACERVFARDPGGERGRAALKTALALFHEARRASLAYHPAVYASLAVMFAQAGYAGRAQWLLQTAELDGVTRMEERYYKALETALVRGGRHAAARDVRAQLTRFMEERQRRGWIPIGSAPSKAHPRVPPYPQPSSL